MGNAIALGNAVALELRIKHIMQLTLAFIGFQTRNPKMYNVYTNHAELQATPFLPTQLVANAVTVKMLKLNKNWTDGRLDIIQHSSTKS